MTAQFLLTTNDIPVKFADGKLTAADGFTADDAANFIKNLATVDINGTSYKATGSKGIKLFKEDGSIDLDATVSDAEVFENSGTYTVTLNSTGYNAPYSFEVNNEAATATTTTKASTTAAKTTSSSSNSPKTGVNGMALPLALLTFAGATAFALRKKND